MKHLNVIGKLFLSLCILCAAVACSSDDDDKKNDSIVGEWQFDTYELQIKPSTSEIKEAIEKVIENLTNESIAKNVATLNEDKTYTIESANGNRIDKGSYSLSGDQLTLNPGQSGSVKLTVVSNSNGKLILDLDLEQLAKEYEIAGTNLLTKANIRITYTALADISN
jgi:hypothetical protein